MSEPWIYRVGLSAHEVTPELLIKSGLKYEEVRVGEALRAHIDETLGKPYKFYTSMRQDAPDFFSCSSLISYLYIFAGIWMPSLVIDKFFFSKSIDREALRFGDLVFSHKDDPTGEYPQRSVSVEYRPGELKSITPVSHVGMYLGEGKIIHASPKSVKGMVVIEELAGNYCFDTVVGCGRVVESLDEKRFVVEVPSDKPDLSNKEKLIDYLTR